MAEKFCWIVACILSELSYGIKGALHRFAALPLTPSTISDLYQSSNPICQHAAAISNRQLSPDMACDIRYSCAVEHDYIAHKHIPLQFDTTHPLCENHTDLCTRFLMC